MAGRWRGGARFGAVAGCLLTLTLVAVMAPGAPRPAAAASGRWGPDALSVPEARQRVANADGLRRDAEARLEELTADRRRLEAERDALGGNDAQIADELAAARAAARDQLVDAYIGGDRWALEQSMMMARPPTEAAYGRVLYDVRRQHIVDTARSYLDRRAAAADALAALADRLDTNAAATTAARGERDRAALAGDAAAEDLAAAIREDDLRAGRVVVRSGDDGAPGPEESGNAKGDGWNRLRACESGQNYAAVSAGGLYRGAYQFDVQTWRSMGGDGDPAEAPPAEQDLRAELLFRSRGWQPWPICGRNLLGDATLYPQGAPTTSVPDPVSDAASVPPSSDPAGGPPGTAPG